MFSVTRKGKNVDPSLYVWDGERRIFATNENNLDLDFSRLGGITFKIGSLCTLEAKSNCNINAGACCNISVGDRCDFNTQGFCKVSSGFGSSFKSMPHCEISSGSGSLFCFCEGSTIQSGKDCAFFGCEESFICGDGHCVFDLLSKCTFDVKARDYVNVYKDCTINNDKGYPVNIINEKIGCTIQNSITHGMFRASMKECKNIDDFRENNKKIMNSHLASAGL